jgi:CxxC motif-containing protein (DUF1111 family)
MLLHDMGDEFSDNATDFAATGNEWRTQPLWGIGLIKIVNGHTIYCTTSEPETLPKLFFGTVARLKIQK